MKITDLYSFWHKIKNKPLGKWFFMRIISIIIPYTGALKSKIIIWDKGYAKVELSDRSGIRNHLSSIHAIALTNLGEFTGGLALVSQFDAFTQGIPVSINIEFLKKARGTLTAECSTVLPVFTGAIEHMVTTEIKDKSNSVVATVTAKWKISDNG